MDGVALGNVLKVMVNQKFCHETAIFFTKYSTANKASKFDLVLEFLQLIRALSPKDFKKFCLTELFELP